MYDVVKHYEKADPQLIEEYKTVGESASIGECMRVNGALNHEFRPIWPGSRMVGSALTVRARPGDNLILHKAITMIQPGDVLVVTCGGFQEAGGMWGGIMSSAAKKMGAAGMVIDGCVRDTMMMKEIDWPVWARGISIKGSTKLTGGQINQPIVIGNVLVHPGDLIFADNDAVVAVPRLEAEEVLEKAKAREEKEERILRAVNEDGTYTFYSGDFCRIYAKLGLKEEE